MIMSPETTTIDRLRANCTLVAAREVTGKPDESIIRAFLARGYQWNRGAHSSVYINAIRDLGFEVEHVSVWKDGVEGSFNKMYVTKATGRENMWGSPIFRSERQTLTVGAFSRKHKRGTFVVSDGGHAFVIRDGIVVDPNLERRGAMRRRKLVDAFLVKDPAPSRKLTVATRLKRNADPLVKFTTVGRIKLRPVEAEARRFTIEKRGLFEVTVKPVRLSEITANTSYTRGDAAWDIRRGRMIVVG